MLTAYLTHFPSHDIHPDALKIIGRVNKVNGSNSFPVVKKLLWWAINLTWLHLWISLLYGLCGNTGGLSHRAGCCSHPKQTWTTKYFCWNEQRQTLQSNLCYHQIYPQSKSRWSSDIWLSHNRSCCGWLQAYLLYFLEFVWSVVHPAPLQERNVNIYERRVILAARPPRFEYYSGTQTYCSKWHLKTNRGKKSYCRLKGG